MSFAKDDYPNPSDAWVKKWSDLCAKYHIRPVEYGHWIDSKRYAEGPEGNEGSAQEPVPRPKCDPPLVVPLENGQLVPESQDLESEGGTGT